MQCTVSVFDIYGCHPRVPDGYKAEFRIPKVGERFLVRYPEEQISIGVTATYTAWTDTEIGGPRLVLVQ
jgi:hypothetical protein